MSDTQETADSATRLECLRLVYSAVGKGMYYGGDPRELLRGAAEMVRFVSSGELPKAHDEA